MDTWRCFFVDDNFAINVKRTKSLLKAIIAADASLPWVAQISINLLRDPELLDLIAASGGHWIFLGLESIDPANLQDVNKSFNKPNEYAAILKNMADRGIYAITSFIFGMDADTTGIADRTLQTIQSWPPGLPLFSLRLHIPVRLFTTDCTTTGVCCSRNIGSTCVPSRWGSPQKT